MRFWAKCVLVCSCPEDALRDLHLLLGQPDAFSQAGLSQHMRNAIQALHVDTLFQIRGRRDFCRTELGMRPGESFADVIFSYLWSQILHLLQDELRRLGMAEDILIRESLHVCAAQRHEDSRIGPFLGPTWMDDACVCVSSSTATGLENKLGHAAGILLCLCEGHALTPNLQPGKAEILMPLRGPGSHQMKTKYFGPRSGHGLWIACENGFLWLEQTFSQHRRYLLQNPL